MNLHEYHQLQAERAALDKLLDQIPIENVIDRMSLEDKKREIEETLAAQTAPTREPTKVKLTFRGKPIVGNYGMFAEFGASAINAFVKAVAAIGASQFGPLGKRGAIPNRNDFQLLITGTALGSFGFELEEAPKDNMLLFPEISPVEVAIEKTKAIMEATLGTDDDLTEAISEAISYAISDDEPRAIDELRAFLHIMATQEAICALEFKDELFRFSDVGQVRRSEQRLQQENIHEEEIEMIGKFLGVLPIHRTFEFSEEGNEEVISGKISPEIEEVGCINRIVEKPSKIKVQKKSVGSGKPRYILLRFEEMPPQDGNTVFSYDVLKP